MHGQQNIKKVCTMFSQTYFCIGKCIYVHYIFIAVIIIIIIIIVIHETNFVSVSHHFTFTDCA